MFQPSKYVLDGTDKIYFDGWNSIIDIMHPQEITKYKGWIRGFKKIDPIPVFPNLFRFTIREKYLINVFIDSRKE